MRTQIILLILAIGVVSANAQIINIPADYSTIQEGIDASEDGDTILVQPGTYYENIYLGFRIITLASLFVTTGDTSYITQTVIDGNQSGSVITCLLWSGEINGFTIQNGVPNDPNFTFDGGGIYLAYIMVGTNTSILRNLIVQNNSEAEKGGGIYCYGNPQFDPDTIIMENVTLQGNKAHNGKGIYCDHIHPIISNSNICNNSDLGDGGGAYFINCDPTITNTIIASNEAHGISTPARGGGIYFENSKPVIQNLVLTDNYPDGIYARNSEISISNATISNNSWIGIKCYQSDISLTNTILCTHENYQIECSTSNISVLYSNIEGGESGIQLMYGSTLVWSEGNIDLDPLFLGVSDHPYQLSSGSPCIDVGTPDTIGMNIPITDMLGNERVWDGNGDGVAIIDMGAYEFGSLPVNIEYLSPVEYDEIYVSNIYPNPCYEMVNIDISSNKTSEISIKIINVIGNLSKHVYQGKLNNGSYKFSADITDLTNGTYFLLIQSVNDQIVQKFVKN